MKCALFPVKSSESPPCVRHWLGQKGRMAHFSRASVTAVLGPTNTGKTHLAVERMCAHSSGMMGFPLRLLAREVYDRVVALKGPNEVALITGEEKIEPPGARWYLCTAESMPIGGAEKQRKDFAFVALDEAQIGIDPERGHIFTDRLLRARGREETMILGSQALAPMVRALLPDAEITSRPRFSTLSYAGAKKLSRLPKRSAIVAFSVEEVYAVAEMLRRLRGGAAVVMGALSPSTRNAQVQMFLNGDVDYLVATDAIGMGLNLDVKHVAFASLRKFDGRRTRRLTVSEMAQIAGRAGRHHSDGSFGSLGGEEGESAFSPEEIEAIEEHEFPRIEHMFWRDGAPPMDSLNALIEALEARPEHPELRAAPQAVDLAVLKAMADDEQVRVRTRSPQLVRRLWDVCGLPDFQKLGPEHHSRMVSRLWRYRSEGNGIVPRDWFAQNIARLDNVQGGVDTLSGRLAAVRTWAYIAYRPDWLADPAEMAERTRALELKLSDALHNALTQRFVDRRTSVLLRDMGRKAEHLPVDIGADGAVQVDGETLGMLNGFRFVVDPQARGGDRKLLLAAAERRLGKMLTVQAEELIAAPDGELVLMAAPGDMPGIGWKDQTVATLHNGPSLLSPEIRIDKAIMALGQDVANRVAARLQLWMKAQHEKHLAPMLKILEQSEQETTPAVVRALFIQLADAGGIVARNDIDDALKLLDKDQRQILRRAGFTIGVLDIYHHALLKPGAALWRLALMAVKRGKPMLPLPQAGAVLLALKVREEQMGARHAGYRSFDDHQIRIDMIERVARGGHEAIAKNERYDATSPFIVSLGLSEPLFNHIMRNAGFRQITPSAASPATSSAPATSEPIVGEADGGVGAEPNKQAEVVLDEQPKASDTPSEDGSEQAQAVPVSEPTPVATVGRDSESFYAVLVSSEFEGGAGEGSEQSGASATEVVAEAAPSGANWVFRGRYRPRERHFFGKAGGDRAQRGTKNERSGKSGGKPHRKGQGNDRRQNRDNVPGRFAQKKSDDRPAGGGAFAGLAELLGRNE